MKKEKAYVDGWVANKEGFTFDSNPHTSVMGSEAARLWSNGWLEAQADTLRKDALLTYDLTQMPIDNTAQQFESLALKPLVWLGEGLPPAGSEVEAMMPVSGSNSRQWTRVIVALATDKDCLVYDVETTVPAWADEFRPIRTEAERRREDTKNAIADLCRSSASNVHSADLIYDAIAAGKIPHIKLES